MNFSTFLTEQKSKAVGIFIGRVTPPTIAHQKIIEDAFRKYSKVYIFIIEGEKTSQLTKNFLSFNQRKEILKVTNPRAIPILAKAGYIPDIIEQNHIDTSNGVAIIAGSDRIDGYMNQFGDVKYNVIPDEIKRTASDVSASKVRAALAEKDFATYKRMIAKGLDNQRWFDELRKRMARKGNEIEEIRSLKDIITEEVNKHIEHFEDNMLNMGVEGIQQNVLIAKTLRDTLSGSSAVKAKITVKWDGAPAVFFGINPENGKFFVSTKAIFNKEPKIAYTPQDVKAYFGHAPNLVTKLIDCLKYLPSLGINTIYQGDLLFTNDKKFEKIDGIASITFTPNTITYAIPNDDSDLAKAVRGARIGIVVHTEYVGKTIDTLSAKYDVNVKRYSNSNVWITDAYFEDDSGIINFTKKEIGDIDYMIGEVERVSRYVKSDIFVKLRDYGIYELFRRFHNEQIKQGAPLNAVSKYFDDFVTYIENALTSLPAKTQATIDKRTQKIEEIKMFLNKYRREIVGIFYLYLLFIRMKNIFVQKLSQISSVGTFIRSGDGYRVTKPEGFCVIDNDGSILKLVDRLEFSRANFTLEKVW
jgi:hypothetical protein